ncbi:MAG: hypothetical protein Q4A56_08320 [Porphyromonadaceae bacterium]|nr:hypothetical protein [Porphyromonadaceae bacterium]
MSYFLQHDLIFLFVFLVNGLKILITSFFTSLGNAFGSIVVAVLRGVVFISLGMLILPRIFGEEGVLDISEFMTFCIAAILLWFVIKRLNRL